MAVTESTLLTRLTVRGALRVPEITVYFWLIKALSTAMGESTSDYLVHRLNPELAVAVGFVGFVAALLLQFSMRRYVAWTYWLGVVMVGVFGTMAADVLHVRFAVPYAVSSALYGVVLMAVFDILLRLVSEPGRMRLSMPKSWRFSTRSRRNSASALPTKPQTPVMRIFMG